MFYIYADKKGTCRNDVGDICVEGNYWPAWVEGASDTYRCFVQWPETLWQQYKLTHDTFDMYLPKCRQNYVSKKRHLDAIRQREDEDEDEQEIASTRQRIRGNPAIWESFPVVPAAVAWLKLFTVDALRYPILVVLGPSGSRKTEWAKSLFSNPLDLKIGPLPHFPDQMRKLNRKVSAADSPSHPPLSGYA